MIEEAKSILVEAGYNYNIARNNLQQIYHLDDNTVKELLSRAYLQTGFFKNGEELCECLDECETNYEFMQNEK